MRIKSQDSDVALLSAICTGCHHAVTCRHVHYDPRRVDGNSGANYNTNYIPITINAQDESGLRRRRRADLPLRRLVDRRCLRNRPYIELAGDGESWGRGNGRDVVWGRRAVRGRRRREEEEETTGRPGEGFGDSLLVCVCVCVCVCVLAAEEEGGGGWMARSARMVTRWPNHVARGPTCE